MGYQTYFSGSVTIEPPLNEDETSFLQDFNHTRRMHRTGGPLYVKGESMMGHHLGPDIDKVLDHNSPDPDQPGLWCQWVPNDDGTVLEWDENEKFYYSADWMEYIVNKLLSPAAKPYIQVHLNEDERLKSFTCDHVVNGEIYADGEESDDLWKLKVTDNLVEALEARLTYGDEEPEVVPPTEAELREALRSIAGVTGGVGPGESIHPFHGYTFEITSVGVDVLDGGGTYVATKVTLEKAVELVIGSDWAS